MTQTMTAAAGVLQKFYLPSVREQLNNSKGATLMQLESGSQYVHGEEAVISVHTGRNAGTGARPELGELPTAGRQGYEKARTTLKNLYGTVEITGQAMLNAQKSPGAFTNVMDGEMKRLVDDIAVDMQRQVMGDGSGGVAVASAAGNAAGVLPIAGSGREVYIQFIIGMSVGVAALGVAPGTEYLVSDFDRAAETVTLTDVNGAVVDLSGVAANDVVSKFGSFGAEITGLRSIVNSGDTLFGIDGAGTKIWNSTTVDLAGANLTELVLETMIDDLSIESGKVADLVVTTHAVLRDYKNSLQAQRRFVTEREFEGGFRGLSVATGEGEIGLLADRYVPAGEILCLDTDALSFQEAQDWAWMDKDGAVLNRTDRDSYGATMFKYCELVTDRRNSMGRIQNAAEL